MIRSIIAVLFFITGGFLLSFFFIGYPRAGAYYINSHKQERKTIRPGGYHYYGSHIGSRGFRGGK